MKKVLVLNYNPQERLISCFRSEIFKFRAEFFLNFEVYTAYRL